MDPIAIAHEMFDAVEQNNLQRFAAVCLPEAVMWHAFRPHEEQPLLQTGKNLGRLHEAVKTLKYADRRYEKIEGGNVLARHVLTGLTALGIQFEVHMSVRLTLSDGKVARVEECVDTSQLKPIYEAMQSLSN